MFLSLACNLVLCCRPAEIQALALFVLVTGVGCTVLCLAGEVPDYATLLAPTPGRLPTPFRSDPKELFSYSEG